MRCGEWDTQTESEPMQHQDRNVSSGAIHQEFNPKNLYNTIALLFLETDFTLASHVDTICLPKYKENFDDRTECYVKVVKRNLLSRFLVSCLRDGARITSVLTPRTRWS